MVVSYLPDPESHPLWDGIRALLKPAAELGCSPVFGDGEVLWVAIEGQTIFGAATSILWDDGEAQLILAAGTRHREWVAELDEAVTEWARLCGARRLTMRGRKGWGRYARRFGWVVLDTDSDGWLRFEKPLNGRS